MNNLSIDKLNIKDDFHMKKDNIEQLFTFLRDNKFDLFLDFLNTFNKNETNININTKDQYGNNLLFLAIMKNQRKIIKKLLELDARTDIFDQEGNSILFYPIKNGYNDLIDLLIDYNRKNIGVNIINIIDKKGYVPLLYAIKYKNLYAVQNLLLAGADSNYRNQSGINVLYYAVQRKDIIMLRMLLKSIRNIDTPGPNGSTPLLNAVLFNEIDIVTELLKANADPNIAEYRYNYIPIFYSVIQSNVNITKMLIGSKTDVNHQDYIGMTIIHHAILNKSYEILHNIFQSYDIVKSKNIMTEDINSKNTIISSNKINPNLVNIDGLTILHMLLYHYDSQFDYYIKKLIPYSNLNIQDNRGNTPMHILFSTNMFAHFNVDNIFDSKKINIAIRNNENKTIFDYIKLNEMESVIDILIDTYYRYLKKYHDEVIINWQKECGEKTLDNYCKNKIRTDILENKISIPHRKTKVPIHIVNNEIVTFSTFTGTVLDQIVGFKYLVKKHTIATILLYPNDYITNEIISDPAKHLTEFEIKWIFQRLVFPPDFENKFKILINSTNCRYVLVPLGIILESDFHSNCLLIDLTKKQIERFEPHGSSYPFQFNYNPDRLDDLLDKSFASIFKNIYGQSSDITYIPPKKYLPKIGFQTFEGVEMQTNTYLGDPNGFCTLWCIWYLDYRLDYPELSSAKVVKKLIKSIRSNNLSFRSVIRNYSKNITDLRDNYLNKIGFDINDYISNKLNTQNLQQLLNLIINE